MGLNVYDYQWRDYDPAIARFNNIDRFAEKYSDLTPYHFTANNPIYFREIAGDSINVADLYRRNDKGEYVNKSRVEAFESFANTKEGKAFLSQFASKGQEVAGVTYDADGEFHEAGVDLNYDTDMSKANQYADGETGANVDDNGRLQIDVSLETSTAYDMVDTIVHESFIHAQRYAVDFADNGKKDYSNIDSDIKKNNRLVSWQHKQERRDTRNKKSLFWKNGYYIMLKTNKKYGTKKTNQKVFEDMYDFRD